MTNGFNFNDRKALPYLLIGGGLALLFLWQYGIGTLWPLFILIPGIVCLYLAFTGTSHDTVDMIFPGMAITATGAILFFQSLFGHWESWTYIWAVYPIVTGFAMRWRGERVSKFEHEITIGNNLMRYGTLGLIGAVAFFEVLIFRSVNAQFIGIGLIALGVIYLVSTRRSAARTTTFSDLVGKAKNDDEKAKFEDSAA
ncbi:MAG: hypothetical protein IT298_13070 [Chloroflexi bacterium]|jgi:hypothetical protein|nr:MAG: hypothetical protein UZ13_00646 [Chloroflexi bacterium OLB13]MBC6956661.1 hypothetical protein [Chloroflexota bacterium]MCO6444844.1 hypothetical protein [Anaerolineae bacterium]MDL1915753.1 hypothetical protein [Anaerolineae bacterium CFX4]OQY77211.1 MAG: hypothetical protein B6D42_16685 [Anaerolineae bacterium UTCFX5]